MTAVDWLEKQLTDAPYIHFGDLFEQAKEMEKQQIIDAAERWKGTDFAEKYYAETYGSKGSDEHHEDNLEEIISKAHTNITRRKGKEYAPTSNEIQAEIEKSEKPINLLSNQEGVFYSHNDVLEMMKKFHTYEMNIELNMLKLTPLNLKSSQTEISDESWEGCDGCTEQDEVMYKNGYVKGYNAAIAELPKEISDEEIEKYASDFYDNNGSESIFILGAKWYREQLKKKQ